MTRCPQASGHELGGGTDSSHSCAQCRAPCRALQKAHLPSTTVDLTTDRDARDYVMSHGRR